MKHIGVALAEDLSSQKHASTRRDNVETTLAGGWLLTTWDERVSLTAVEFAEMLTKLGPFPTEEAILREIGTEPEGVQRNSLRFTYGIDPRRGMRPCVVVRYRATSADDMGAYLANLAGAVQAVQQVASL